MPRSGRRGHGWRRGRDLDMTRGARREARPCQCRAPRAWGRREGRPYGRVMPELRRTLPHPGQATGWPWGLGGSTRWVRGISTGSSDA